MLSNKETTSKDSNEWVEGTLILVIISFSSQLFLMNESIFPKTGYRILRGSTCVKFSKNRFFFWHFLHLHDMTNDGLKQISWIQPN